jgi:FkbM family methyltransferase
MYSQHEEDDIIGNLFGDYVGRFLDIGANDGHYLSNTLALAERGWCGVAVEPNPETFLALWEHYRSEQIHVSCCNFAMGLQDGITAFWQATKDNGLSTTEHAHALRREAEGLFRQPFWVSMVSIGRLLDQFPGHFDFLSIDTEGTSVDLFQAFPFSRVQPRVVCVEHDDRVQECIDHAGLWGYRLVHQNPINLIFEKRP